ncbi:MAG: hypothetical protein ACRC2M_24400 [Planktothrix sp.]
MNCPYPNSFSNKIDQDLRKFGDVTLDVGVIHELPLLLIAVMRKSC